MQTVFAEWPNVGPITAYKAIPNGHGGVLVAWEQFEDYGYPQVKAYVAGVASDGTAGGISQLGDSWSGRAGLGALVLGEQDQVVATTYVGRYLTQVAVLTPEGYLAAWGDYGARDITSVLAGAGGSFVTSLSDGTVYGDDPDYDLMHLTKVQYFSDGAWLGSQGANLDAMVGPWFRRASTDWRMFAGGEQANNSPPLSCGFCIKGYRPPVGHGPAFATDDRRVITVAIDASWDDSPGQTNARVWNATEGAITMWNDATDRHGSRTGFFFKMDQEGVYGTPDITIKKASCDIGAGLACSTFPGAKGDQYHLPSTLKLSHSNVLLPGSHDRFILARIAHEFAHKLGGSGKGICPATILEGSYPDGTRDERGCSVSQSDVELVNIALKTPGRCTGIAPPPPNPIFTDPREICGARVPVSRCRCSRSDWSMAAVVSRERLGALFTFLTALRLR